MTTKIETFVGQNVDGHVNNWLAENEGKRIVGNKEIETSVLNIKIAAVERYDYSLSNWVTDVVVTIIYREKVTEVE